MQAATTSDKGLLLLVLEFLVRPFAARSLDWRMTRDRQDDDLRVPRLLLDAGLLEDILQQNLVLCRESVVD